MSNLNVGLDWKIDTQSLLRNQILVPQKSLMYKDVHDNISAKFTNYIKQGASSNDQNLLMKNWKKIYPQLLLVLQ